MLVYLLSLANAPPTAGGSRWHRINRCPAPPLSAVPCWQSSVIPAVVAGRAAFSSVPGRASAAAAAAPPVRADIGVSAYPFGARPGPADRQPLAGQPEPHAVLPAVRRRRPAAVQLPRQPPAAANGAPRAAAGTPRPSRFRTHAGALPHRLGAGVRRARRHHLPGEGQLHGRRAGQVPGQQRRRRVPRRLPVRLSRSPTSPRSRAAQAV